MTDFDTFRWGDRQTLLLRDASAGGEQGIVNSSQMLNAVWQRPVVWRLMVSMKPEIDLVADAGITFEVAILLFIGVGQANDEVPLLVVPFATPFNPVTTFFDIPAEAMQLRFAVGNLSNSVTSQSNVKVNAFTAPHAEPGAIAQMRDKMHAARHNVVHPDQEGLDPWMPPGFDDGELRYRHGGR